jgi:hypothetical protein
MRLLRPLSTAALAASLVAPVLPARGERVRRDERWPPRGSWNRALARELPRLYREFNGIDFGHAHLAETLLRTQEPAEVERARLQVLEFIFRAPRVPPDEFQVVPTASRLAWGVQRAFDWAHELHRSLYDLFASGHARDPEATYRRILSDYIGKPEAITSHRLDHHGKLWSFPESKSFRDRFPEFNSQIWAYHWLQAAVYDVQLAGGTETQHSLLPRVIEWYHGYLMEPPVEWQFMPLMPEGAPWFSERFPEAAAIFDNLHMLHDNVDDVLSRPDLYPTMASKRQALVGILPVYLHANHVPADRFAGYHARLGAHASHGAGGPRPPSAADVLEGRASRRGPEPSGHGDHGP